MTENDFRTNIEFNKEMELLYRDKKYTLTYGTDQNGKKYISFGESYLPLKKYNTYKELLNNAQVGISPLRYAIENLTLLN